MQYSVTTCTASTFKNVIFEKYLVQRHNLNPQFCQHTGQALGIYCNAAAFGPFICVAVDVSHSCLHIGLL